MLQILKYGMLGFVGATGVIVSVPMAHADTVKSGDLVQIAGNAWAERNGYRLTNHRNWQGYVASVTNIPRTSYSNQMYHVVYGNGQSNYYVLSQDVKQISLNNAKYKVGSTVQIANNAWAEANGYRMTNHRNWTGTVVSRRAIIHNSNSQYEYYIKYADGSRNEHVLEQDVSSSSSKYSVGSTVKLNSNAWAESNGYNLVNHRNWVGTVTAVRPIGRNSYSGYSYTVKYQNGEHNDYVLEQDLSKYVTPVASVSAGDIGSQVNNTTPNVDVTVLNLKTNQTTRYTKGSIDINYTASMIKAGILVELAHEQPNLTSSQKAIAYKMITESDNDSATALFKQIGKDAGIQRLINNLGMSHSLISGTNQWGLTSTTSEDYMKVMKQIFVGGSYISASNREYIQSLMNNVDKNQRWGLPANYSSDSKVYVKDGWLPLGNNYTNAIINSASRVKNSKSDYIVVQMSNEDNTQNDGLDMLNRIGQKVYDKLNQ